MNSADKYLKIVCLSSRHDTSRKSNLLNFCLLHSTFYRQILDIRCDFHGHTHSVIKSCCISQFKHSKYLFQINSCIEVLIQVYIENRRNLLCFIHGVYNMRSTNTYSKSLLTKSHWFDFHDWNNIWFWVSCLRIVISAFPVAKISIKNTEIFFFDRIVKTSLTHYLLYKIEIYRDKMLTIFHILYDTIYYGEC